MSKFKQETAKQKSIDGINFDRFFNCSRREFRHVYDIQFADCVVIMLSQSVLSVKA